MAIAGAKARSQGSLSTRSCPLQVVVRRNRLCVAIKAGRQSALPKGSMSLATSSTGAQQPVGVVS